MTPESPVLLYDGACGLCAGSVQFILRHETPERRRALRFAPLQGEFGAAVRAAHPALASIDSVMWVAPSATPDAPPLVLVRSAASLAVLAHLGGRWRLLATIGRLVPPVLRDIVYDAIAKRRFNMVAPSCLLPTADDRYRFLP